MSLKLNRMETVYVQVGNDAVCKAYLRDSVGDSATFGQGGTSIAVTVSFDQLVKEFGAFDATHQTGVTQTWMVAPPGVIPVTGATGNTYDPPLTDSSWIPGIHGSEGYNLEMTILAATIPDVGWYRYRLLILGQIQDWNIGVRG